MRIKLLLFVILLVLAAGFASAAEKKGSRKSPVVKQRDFAVQLVTALHLEKGLPSKPKESDYLAILGGKRAYRFEAEDIYNVKTDSVPVRTFGIYGPFSGRGWLSGTAVPATAHFRIFLPLDGDYALTAGVKGNGQIWTVEGKSFTVSGGESFSPAAVGTVFLAAGEHEVTVSLPPESGVDYLDLTAPDTTPIQPLGGWHFDAPLKRSQAAEVAVALLGLENTFPVAAGDSALSISVTDVITYPPTVSPATADYYGRFYSKNWVRAGYRPVTVEIPVNIDKKGVYGIRINHLGTSFSALLDDKKVVRKGKPSFSWIDLGTYPLSSGAHKLKVDLGPSDGIDVINLERRQSAPEDYMTAAGFKGEPGGEVKESEKNAMIATMTDRYKSRR